MGNCFETECKKCGVPRSYYEKIPTPSCRNHEYNGDGYCSRCDEDDGNCYHNFSSRWSYTSVKVICNEHFVV